MIELRRLVAALSRYPRREQSDAKTQRPQQGGKRSIQLIAESASTLFSDLANECIFVDDDPVAERNVEILKRDSEEVRAVERAEGLIVGTVEPE